jgi:hypothetical protein
MPLQAAMQGGASQVRQRDRQGLQAIVQQEQRMLAKGNNKRSSSGVKIVEQGCFGPIGASCTCVRFFHFATVFGFSTYRFASLAMLSLLS